LQVLRLDLHVHTIRSYDGHTRVEDLPSLIRDKGLDGLAITEHDNFDPPSFADVLILPGIEVTSRNGHVIGLGVRERIPPRLSADETIREIHRQDGVAVIPHPFDPVCECVKIARLTVKPDAVEVINADALSFHISNWLAKRDAKKFNLPQVGGSDSHIPQSIGDAYTLVQCEGRDADSLIQAIRAGRVRASGHPTSVMNKLRKLGYRFK